jgi:hypothetical protein
VDSASIGQGAVRSGVSTYTKYRMFRKELYNFESLYLFRGMYRVFNCHNVTKRRVLPGIVRFNVTSTGNVGCFKKSFTTLKAGARGNLVVKVLGYKPEGGGFEAR